MPTLWSVFYEWKQFVVHFTHYYVLKVTDLLFQALYDMVLKKIQIFESQLFILQICVKRFVNLLNFLDVNNWQVLILEKIYRLIQDGLLVRTSILICVTLVYILLSPSETPWRVKSATGRQN